ncbi:MAG TPA: glycosyltransferase 87 family protein [Streptosporangiaceae bacterium]|nr:glycosyltransferase 87 family protein [Streptosporangiaceae bacterium]
MQAQADWEPAGAASPERPRQFPWRRLLGSGGLILATLLFLLSLTAFLVDQAVHRHAILTWYDLKVYNDAGLITRQLPSILYTWELKVGVQFTYTPFAGLVFAGGSLLPFVTLRWVMTIASLAAIPVTAWLTLGGMGRRGTGRLAAALAVSAPALWLEPVVKALYLGQIEPLLMLLVVWDLTRKDTRPWKGIGIGVAAGIKLVPLLFIPYLLLSGKIRQAAVATGAFIATVVIGFIALPGPSASYWLTGYFIRPGRTGSVHSLVNQSLLGALSRLYGAVASAQPVWLAIALVVAGVGLVGGAMLNRTGRPVHGWTLVAMTSVLVSPISWDHHWVWVVPVLALIAGLTFTARPIVKVCTVAGIVIISGVMASWPWKYSGPQAYVPRRGLLGWFVKPPENTHVALVHGWQVLTWNLWVAIGMVIYLALVAAAIVAWRVRPRRKVFVVTPQSTIDALLARADAVLRGGALAGVPGDGNGEHGNGEVNGGSAGSLSGKDKAEDDASRPAASLPRPAR